MNSEFDRIAQDDFVSAEDVLTLRRSVFADGILDREELDKLFRLADRSPHGAREWHDFFGEATSDFFLREESPQGYLTQEEFNHVRDWVLRDGHVVNALELDMMIRLLQRAISTPDEMSEFVGGQIRKMIIERGPAASITEADTQLIRNYLYAAGGDNTYGISRQEANLLFDLNDATAANENHADWQTLFSKAVAAHLMQYAGFKVQPREQALAQHDWMQDTSIDVGGFLAKVGQAAIRGDFAAFWKKEPDLQGIRNAEIEAESAIEAEVTSAETDWLADRFAANGALCEAEKAVLLYMRDDLDAELPSRLNGLLTDAA